MDIRQKLKQLLINNKQGSNRSPISPIETSACLPGDAAEFNVNKPEPPTDEEILATVEDIYYSGSTFDASEHVLEKLPDELDLNEIHSDRQKLRRQLQVVSKRVSDLILQKQPAYMEELQRVTELQSDLQVALETCHIGRNFLDQAKGQFTIASLGILANYSKRQQIIGLLRSLRTVKTLQQTDVRLREMLDEEDFPGAIQLCLECQKAASTFKHFKCITELTSKLQDTLEMIEEHLDVALSKVCNNFNTHHYEKLQIAYKLLGKTQMAMDQLHMHFTSAIHNTAFIIVLGYVELCAGGNDMSFHKSQYSDLCKNMTSESFTPCLVDLCKALWEVMHSYHKIMEWHEMNDSKNQIEDAENPGSKAEGSFNHQYMHKKLEHGVTRIWQDVQQKVKIYLLASDLSGFKFNEFIRVLDLVNRLINTGEEFCGSKSEELQESVRKHSINYFRNYHRARMEEMRMFLENEGWELCPVKYNFSITQLLEYRFLRDSKLIRSGSVVSSGTPASNRSEEHTPENNSVQISNTNPFDITMDDEESEDVLENSNSGNRRSCDETDSDDSDIPDELKQDFVDEQTGDVVLKNKHSKYAKKRNFKSSKGHAPIMTNTTLNVLRLFGKYMQMMTVLKPIAFDVIIYMTQLFDYYMFAVANFFATGSSENFDLALSSRLRATLKRIADNLILDDDIENDINSLASDSRNRDKVFKPKLSSVVDLTSSDTLLGLAERIVAAESLVFLAEQFEYLQQYLDVLIPVPKKTFLQQFYSQTVIMATELRRPVYVVVATNAINSEQILNLMSNVKWDVREIMSQHSSYVDVLLREIQVFSMRLTEVYKLVPIPREAYNILWEYCIRITNKTLVEGFASAKKCSNEGRALMQLDFQQFLIKLEKITELRPIPDKDYVESYVKAYYLPDVTLEDWIKNHTEYSVKQVTALLNCISQINKKTRQKLITITEDTRR